MVTTNMKTLTTLTTLAILAIVIGSSGPARAASYTGAEWYGRCVTGYKHNINTMTPEETLQAGTCNGVLMGASNIGACLPGNLTVGDIQKAVAAYMQQHPEAFVQSIYPTINSVARQTWPCSNYNR